MGKKKVIGMLLIVLIVANLFNPLVVNSQEKNAVTVVVTLKEAQDKALQNVDSINQVNRQLSNLLKRNDCTFNNGEYNISNIEQTIDSLYTKLKNGKAMYSKEVGKLFILYTMYGDTVYFSGKEDITKYMNPKSYPKYSLWANVMKQSISTQIIEANIKNQTRLLYDKILSLKEQLDISKITTDLQQMTFKQIESRYGVGEVSKVSLEIAEKQLKIKKLEMGKLSRTLENLEIDLKKLTGVPIENKIVLVDYSTINKEQFETYEIYLRSALINRREIVTAKIDFWVGKNDLSIANNAFSDNPWNVNTKMSKNMAEQKINEAVLLMSEGNESVLQNIADAYIDVKCKREEMDISKENLDYANKQYIIATEKHKKQMLSEYEKEREKINYLSILSAYNDAVRTYDFALARIQQASKLGVAY